MRIKEIGTVIAAGIVSLAALVLLENQDSAPAPYIESQSKTELIAFEDTSSILESSVPAPTPNPPTTEETIDLFEEAGEVPEESAPTQLLADLDDIDGSASIHDLSEHPDEASPAPENTDLAVIDSDETDLAGINPDADLTPNEPAEFSDSFASAIAEATGSPVVTETATESVSGEPASIIEETPTGFWLREAKLNDVFQHLTQLGNYQYFHNAELEGPSFIVTGQLMDDDPIVQMEELALMYGVTIHKQGNTIYAFNSAQLSQLPTEPFRYQLKYLRPSDIEQIKMILAPFLTPGSGIIEYESKTNTLIVMDNTRRLDALALFLSQIDQPKQQVAIETRILRVTSGSANRIGVDWSSVLGETGLSIGASTSLNSLFNLPELYEATSILTSGPSGQILNQSSQSSITSPNTTGAVQNNDAGLVLAPAQLRAVVRALNEGDLAQQESSPTLITEDNEQGLISIIDRIPIITATVTESASGQNITEEVRYQIDENDPVGDPATTREIGVSVAVTPTILPDGTIRMALRPRSAQVVEFIQGANGNQYPRVNESTVTTTARVPNGHSLLIGGFYEEVQSEKSNKIPILGDIPAINLLFKSSEKTKEHTSLVFIVTPNLYSPNDALQNDLMSHEIHESHILPTDHEYPDREHPGANSKTDLRNSMNNLFKKYEPDPPSHLLHPGHPYNRPESLPVHGKRDSNSDRQPEFENPSVTVRSVDDNRNNRGLFGNLFGKNKSNQ